MKQILVFTLIALMLFKDKITKEIINPGKNSRLMILTG